MFEHHFGLLENPFPAAPAQVRVSEPRAHGSACSLALWHRRPRTVPLITGEVGRARRPRSNVRAQRVGRSLAVAMITNSALSRQEMLEEICCASTWSCRPASANPRRWWRWRTPDHRAQRGEHAVLMMDEAQNLSMDLLEEIRLLSNLEHKGDKLLQIFLVGQPELEAASRAARTAPVAPAHHRTLPPEPALAR